MSPCLVCTRISRSMLRAILLNIFSIRLSHEPCLDEDELKALRPARQVTLRFLRITSDFELIDPVVVGGFHRGHVLVSGM